MPVGYEIRRVEKNRRTREGLEKHGLADLRANEQVPDWLPVSDLSYSLEPYAFQQEPRKRVSLCWKERAKNLTSLPIPLNRQAQQLVLAYSRTCTIDCFKASHLSNATKLYYYYPMRGGLDNRCPGDWCSAQLRLVRLDCQTRW